MYDVEIVVVTGMYALFLIINYRQYFVIEETQLQSLVSKQCASTSQNSKAPLKSVLSDFRAGIELRLTLAHCFDTNANGSRSSFSDTISSTITTLIC